MYSILITKSNRENNKSLYQWYLNQDNEIFETDDVNILANELDMIASYTPLNDIKIIKNVDFELETIIEGIRVPDDEINDEPTDENIPSEDEPTDENVSDDNTSETDEEI